MHYMSWSDRRWETCFIRLPLYGDLRESLFSEVKRSNVHFIILSDDDKFIYLFKSTDCYDTVAKTCFNILSRRNSFFIFLVI
jgi:hypothetical protein